MTEAEFMEYKESDGWSSDEEGDNQVSFTNGKAISKVYDQMFILCFLISKHLKSGCMLEAKVCIGCVNSHPFPRGSFNM